METLINLASQQKQMDYKNTVPFVHIPYELICLWEGCFIKDQNWFREIWTDKQWSALNSYNEKFKQISCQILEDDFVDVPEAFENPLWKKLISLSKETINKLKTEPNKTKN